MGDVKQTFSGDASGLEKELAKLQREIIKLREENSKTARESIADTQQQERALKRLGESIKREQITPLEEYRQKLGQIRQAEKAGILTREQANRAAKDAAQAAREATPAYQQLQQAEKAAAGAAAQHKAAQEKAREELRRFADGVKRSLDPLSEYRDRLRQLRDAHRAGDLTQDQYRKSVDQLKKSLREASPAYKAAQREIAETERKTRQHEAAVKQFAQSVKREIATPLEQYRERLVRIREAHRQGELSQDEYRRSVDQLKRSVREANTPLRSATQTQSIFAGASQRLMGVASAWLSIGAAVAVVNRELQLKLELEAKSRDTQITVGDSQADLRTNMVAYSAAEQQQMIRDVGNIQRETGFPDQKVLFQAAAAGISGGGTPQQVVESIREAAKASAHKPEELQTLVGTMIDISKSSGISDAKANLALTLSAQSQARSVELGKLASSLPKSLASAVGTDETNNPLRAVREGATLHAVISNIVSDDQVRSTGTAVTALNVQMREFFQQEGRSDPGHSFGRIEALQNDPQLRAKFLEAATFEREFQVPMEKLVTPGTSASAAVAKAFPHVNFDPKQVESLQTDLGVEGMTPEIRMSAAQRIAMSNQQQSELDDPIGGRRALARDILMDSIQRTNDSFTTTWRQSGVGFDFATENIDNPEQYAIETLKGLVEAEKRDFGFLKPSDQLSDKSKRDIEFLEKQISLLERIAASLDEKEKLPNQQTTAVQVDQHR